MTAPVLPVASAGAASPPVSPAANVDLATANIAAAQTAKLAGINTLSTGGTLPAGVDAAAWVRIQASIERELHFILPAADDQSGYGAQNMATGLDLAFGAQGGVRVTPARSRTDAAPAWAWGLRAAAVGVGDQLAAVSRPTQRTAHDDTLTNAYSVPWMPAGRQPGPLVEWFYNSSGYADIAVSAPSYNDDQGRVYVFHGSANGPLRTPDSSGWSDVGEGGENSFGYALAGTRLVKRRHLDHCGRSHQPHRRGQRGPSDRVCPRRASADRRGAGGGAAWPVPTLLAVHPFLTARAARLGGRISPPNLAG